MGEDCSVELASVFFADVWFKVVDGCLMGLFVDDFGVTIGDIVGHVYGRGDSLGHFVGSCFCQITRHTTYEHPTTMIRQITMNVLGGPNTIH